MEIIKHPVRTTSNKTSGVSFWKASLASFSHTSSGCERITTNAATEVSNGAIYSLSPARLLGLKSLVFFGGGPRAGEEDWEQRQGTQEQGH